MFMDCMRKQTYQCAQHKPKIVTKHDSRNKHFLIESEQSEHPVPRTVALHFVLFECGKYSRLWTRLMFNVWFIQM